MCGHVGSGGCLKVVWRSHMFCHKYTRCYGERPLVYIIYGRVSHSGDKIIRKSERGKHIREDILPYK